MQISKRLEAVADMVTSGCKVADIGTDHGYIPIYLAEAGRIPGAIAMDVNTGPLDRAKENIRLHGLKQKIETRLSDGLASLEPGEADCIIIAGMGGPLSVRILTEGEECLKKCRELILQPQSEIRQVRAFLEENGWIIIREEMILEDGKYYPMMKAVHREKDSTKMNELELRYGPLLLAARHPVLHQFLKKERDTSLRICDSLAGQNSEQAVRRRKELEKERNLIRKALELFPAETDRNN